MDFIGRVAGVGDLHRHGGMARRLFHLDAVGIPADGRGAAVLSAQVGAEGDGISGQALLAGDLDRQAGKDRCDIQILLEVCIRAGLAGLAVAPFDEHMIFCRNCGNGQRLGRICHGVVERFAGIAAAAQRTAAALLDLIAHLVMHRRLLAFAGACAGAGALARAFTFADTGGRAFTAGGFGAARCLHRRTRV